MGLYTDKPWTRASWWALGVVFALIFGALIYRIIRPEPMTDAPGLPPHLQQKDYKIQPRF